MLFEGTVVLNVPNSVFYKKNQTFLFFVEIWGEKQIDLGWTLDALAM